MFIFLVGHVGMFIFLSGACRECGVQGCSYSLVGRVGTFIFLCRACRDVHIPSRAFRDVRIP